MLYVNDIVTNIKYINHGKLAIGNYIRGRSYSTLKVRKLRFSPLGIQEE